MHKQKHNKAKIIGDSPCPKCREHGGDKTGNHLIHFEDGGKYCNRCGYSENSSIKQDLSDDIGEEVGMLTLNEIMALRPLKIDSRGISEEVVSFYGVKCATSLENNTIVSEIYFPYYQSIGGNDPQGYKVRELSSKTFYSVGVTKKSKLFGQQLFEGGGKFLVITEGELDCLAAYQIFLDNGKKYRVVSLPNGASTSGFREELEWLSSFEKIVLAFDQDAVGQKAAVDCAALLPIGKVAIAKWGNGFKDANEILLAGKGSIFINAINNASIVRPDGILSSADVRERVKNGLPKAIAEYPFNGLNKMLHGIREAELITISAGSGVGKSQFLREITHHLTTQTDYKIGLMMMEESVEKTVTSLASLLVSKNLQLHADNSDNSAVNALLDMDKLYFYDHFGSNDIDVILQKIRFFANGLGCKFIILDHISIIVSAQDGGMDERKLIDQLMTKLRTLVQELKITIFAVSHLKRPEGSKGFEEGLKTSLGHLRGSAAIAQLSDTVLGLERNQQADNEEDRNITTVRVLKNRFSGETGVATILNYDIITGRMVEKGFDIAIS